ncbi:hypothetical protein FD06_GL000068 [Apilactobacillus ozensis DSM 23829 = JCM 17196]|uniref:Cell division protein n=1 Tax=Apilactobacillus ozensis DSM 23829 = JCM 17196 TaxID=1423781 RepID=A0A0R2ARG2_9LACO|nr:hypothetical protein [Apilactobacillus ozensis]KRM69902.1 hypothetical protein FD06_GL000068 [Apilactobacillus ozensis DSM 23829 = JCM 17196]
MPQIINRATIVGVDTIFHINRFYDTAMQIKTGHFNYFISQFGFEHSGRMVNSLYGPGLAYLMGLIVLCAGSWFHFQLITSVLVMFVAGASMYYLCRKNDINMIFSTFLGLLFMLCPPIMEWVNGNQFTGLGAAVTPLVIVQGTLMLKKLDINVFSLAFVMSLVLQVHVMTSLISALALIPFFITTFMKTTNRLDILKKLFLSIGLTLVLTANVWSVMLETFTSNHLLPVFPREHMSVGTVGLSFLDNDVLQFIPLTYLIIIGCFIIVFVWKFRTISLDLRIFGIVGLIFLLISTKLFPWDALQSLVPSIAFNIQSPKRFVTVAYVLILLTFGKLMSSDLILRNDLIKIAFMALLLIVTNYTQIINNQYKQIDAWHSDKVISMHSNVYFKKHFSAHEVRDAFVGSNLSTVFSLMDKGTPDYLPVDHKYDAQQYYNLHPYRLYNLEFINHHHKFNYLVDYNGRLNVTWNSKHNRVIRVPVVKYKNTEVVFNGKKLDNVKTSSIGAMLLQSKKGKNNITIEYNADKYVYILMLISLFAWIIFILTWIMITCNMHKQKEND